MHPNTDSNVQKYAFDIQHDGLEWVATARYVDRRTGYAKEFEAGRGSTPVTAAINAEIYVRTHHAH